MADAAPAGRAEIQHPERATDRDVSLHRNAYPAPTVRGYDPRAHAHWYAKPIRRRPE
jgi:hypothetical protein